MKTLRRTAFAILLATALPCAAAEADLSSRVNAADGWSGYRVPLVAGVGEPCCFDEHAASAQHGRCDLDGRHWSFGSHDGVRPSSNAAELAVYLHVAGGHVDRVRAVAASCDVHSATPVRWIDAVDPAQSVKLLAGWLDEKPPARGRDDSALVALAYHADAAATQALLQRSAATRPRDEREQAVFWLGQARGTEGADLVEHLATTDGDPQLRAHAVFVLSQVRIGDSYARIRQISSSDPSEHVRSQALFWMAQTEDERAAADITSSLRTEQSSEVREQAVFAMSQLKDDKADTALIALLRGDYPRDVKKQALFWLSQSGSPRALQFLDETLK
ncbi:MAG TPA: HEAT repeat domain-containing protein [Dokdonella sp.]